MPKTVLAEPHNDVYIPEDIRNAYDDMALSDTQMGAFDDRMMVAIKQVKSIIKRENAERRIKSKVRRIFNCHTPELVAVLEPQQITAFEHYIDLMHATMTTSSSRKLKDRVNDPRPGMQVRDL